MGRDTSTSTVHTSAPRMRSKFFQLSSFLPPSTGFLRVQLPLSRTSSSADHAGHSPPPDLLKELTSSRTETLFPFPSRNLLTALDPTETTDATVDLWTTDSNTLRLRDFALNLLILTPQGMEPASPAALSKSRSLDTPMSPLTTRML